MRRENYNRSYPSRFVTVSVSLSALLKRNT